MRTPKSFKIRGQTISVKFKKYNHLKDMEENLGMAKLLENKILVRTEIEGHKISLEQQIATFWHEVVHMILFSMDEHEINTNEKFVNQLGITIGEVIDSIEYK